MLMRVHHQKTNWICSFPKEIVVTLWNYCHHYIYGMLFCFYFYSFLVCWLASEWHRALSQVVIFHEMSHRDPLSTQVRPAAIFFFFPYSCTLRFVCDHHPTPPSSSLPTHTFTGWELIDRTNYLNHGTVRNKSLLPTAAMTEILEILPREPNPREVKMQSYNSINFLFQNLSSCACDLFQLLCRSHNPCIRQPPTLWQ